MSITPAKPEKDWLNGYLQDSLTKSAVYKIATPEVDLKLDQNESPFDWPKELKETICRKLAEIPWNRYPQAYPKDLEKLIADYAGVDPGCVILSPGSNYLNTLTLSMFGKNLPGRLVITRPSFVLYENHCAYDGIEFTPWLLDEDLEYSPETLPDLPDGSMVVFASPNNPVGNTLPKEMFRKLLKDHPKTLFISDEAYYEFSKEPSTDLLKDHPNLIIIRTFSKTMGAAGVRLGYLLAAPEYIDQIRKMMLPFMINQFTYIAAREVLSDQKTLDGFKTMVDMIIEERTRMHGELNRIGKEKKFVAKDSGANFLLLRFECHDNCQASYSKLIELGVLTRNVSKGPSLAGCLRLTLGTPEQNNQVLEAFSKI